jgi:hypothetical protein
LEWGGNNHAFIFNIYSELFVKERVMQNLLHPIILTALLSQLMILFYVLTGSLSKMILKSVVGIYAFIVIFFLVIGLLSKSYLMVLSTIPFFITITVFYKTSK